MPPVKVTFKDVRTSILKLTRRPEKLKNYLDYIIPFLRGPSIKSFSPRICYPGAKLEIQGANFALSRQDNEVTVNGKPAMVVKADHSKLKVITDPGTTTGQVKVKIGTRTAVGPYDFKTLPYPTPDSERDGPPILFAGKGYGQQGDLPATGTLSLLVVLVNPADRVPTNATASRNSVQDTWNDVHTFYDQASYSDLDVDIDLTTSWHTLTGNFNDYVTGDNVQSSVKDRLMAEAAQAAVDEGLDLDNYDLMACVIYLNGSFIRGWGGWSRTNFSYNDGSGTNINITVNHDLNLLVVHEAADWGRCAHEVGHSIVSAPLGLSASPGAATLGEDVYSSDLIDASVATAASFEMMGHSDSHPLFSAYHMDKIGYYDTTNILDLQWDRNAFRQEYEVVAHGLVENAAGARYHLIKIRVAEGLYYYVEVRQRPGTTGQIFDDSIPLAGAPQQGGVVVTKVLTDVMNMNQQMRFITLLHGPHVLKEGATAIDPARALKITVVDDQVVTRPLVCRVRVEWAQGIADDPNGAFDLRIEPWDSEWQTPDIWIDRVPFGVYDQPLDTEGRPEGNGDKPRPEEINLFWARIHCDGTVAANNVKVTFYSVEPPGVGDNGNWAPLKTVTIPKIVSEGFADVCTNWVPVVDRHTCLKVWAEQQLGEITGGNNLAQENIGQFEAAASSVPSPVFMPVAVRNPLKKRTIVLISVKGVPYGYTVHFPHAWVWLDPLEERNMELVVIPTLDYGRGFYKEIPQANIRVVGDIPRVYTEMIPPGIMPPSRMLAIGGVTYQVKPKQSVTIILEAGEKDNIITVEGQIIPAMEGEILRVDLIDPADRKRVAEVKTDGSGCFNAAFDLTIVPSLDISAPGQPKELPPLGVYQVQAFTINSPNAAQAESNIIYISKS